MAFLVWLEAFRSSWAVGPDVIAARRWAVWRTFRSDEVTAVDIDPGEPGIDLSIGGRGLSRVVVPLDDWRRRPGAIDRLSEFLADAERAGARVDPLVNDALRRRPVERPLVGTQMRARPVTELIRRSARRRRLRPG